MASNFTVTASNLKSASQQLDNLRGQFDAAVKDLESTEASLNGMWEGEARNAFHKTFSADKAQMTQFSQLIQKYVATLSDIASNYEKAEAQNVSTATTRK